MSEKFVYRSHAKINLYLDILNERPDGFTNIETILQSISLCDQLTFQRQPSGISLTCDHPSLPVNEENLIYRAARLMREWAQSDFGVRIHAQKRVPIAAGLAGGSSNAAATLLALNSLWELQWPIERLQELAQDLGSDVPFCTIGGTVAATGRGEKLQSLPAIQETWFVLVHPPLAILARSVYHHERLSRNRETMIGGRTASFRGAIASLEENEIRPIVFNRMESAVFFDHPELNTMKLKLVEMGCSAAAMSGSGSTLFGLCESKEQAQTIAKRITGVPVSVVHSVPAGIEHVE
ncbi:MAG: 4-(cytidine 5'-diphospho)-2-C-methyl-D-erythritol kinase [Candidatus Hydrogenedentes bacterium]|nr:4-(cytidine 5'-diphospho)-2-C-methyl-D-erythritol kinase [Candidatus Hydrogenedentota bacterium]